MAKTLVIIESPGKLKAISSYLGKNYKVISTQGHVRQLATKTKAVEIFPDKIQLQWVNNEKKINAIKDEIEKASKILLACDMDLEGGGICWHLTQLFNKPMKRITFVEITKEALQQALEKESELDQNLVNAYLSRTVMDHIVGLKISLMLMKRFPYLKTLSAGRVQSPTLSFIVNKEKERLKHKTVFSYSLDAVFQPKNDKETNERLKAILINSDEELLINEQEPLKKSKKKTKTEFSKTQLEYLLGIAQKSEFIIEKITKKEKLVESNPPFDTASLQQEAYTKLNFKIDKTMKIAQKLYEGVTLQSTISIAKFEKEKSVEYIQEAGTQLGLITYMRTDSFNISEQAYLSVENFINLNYPGFFKKQKYKTKAAHAQEAHECIRPTNPFLAPHLIKFSLSDEEYVLYDLIWCRFVSSQMEAAKKENYNIVISNGQLEFLSTKTLIVHLGWMILYKTKIEKNYDFKKGTELKIENIEVVEHQTEPPFRFNEGSLVKEMKRAEIGRPSTYANILNILQQRNYVYLENKAFLPSLKGEVIFSFLKTYLPNYVDVSLTAKMEEYLDKIADGKEDYIKILFNFSQQLNFDLDNLSKVPLLEIMNNLTKELEEFLIYKECCGKSMDLAVKYNFFLVCKICGTQQKIDDLANDFNFHENEKDNIMERKVIYTSKWSYIKEGEKRIFLPQLFLKDYAKSKSISFEELVKEPIILEEDLWQWILSLPRELFKYENESVIAAMSKFGFYIKYKEKHMSVNFKKQMTFSQEDLLRLISSK